MGRAGGQGRPVTCHRGAGEGRAEKVTLDNGVKEPKSSVRPQPRPVRSQGPAVCPVLLRLFPLCIGPPGLVTVLRHRGHTVHQAGGAHAFGDLSVQKGTRGTSGRPMVRSRRSDVPRG